MKPHQIVSVCALCQLDGRLPLAVGHVEELAWLVAHLGDHQIAYVREQIARRMRQIIAVLDELIDDLEAVFGAALNERCCELVQDGARGHAEHAGDLFTDELLTAPRDRLVEQAHRVSHAARRLARHQRHGRVIRLDRLLVEHEAKTRRDGRRWDHLEIVALAA